MVTQDEFRLRRIALGSQMSNNSVAIVAANHEILRNGDAHYRFRQSSNFYYLTGFEEPDAVMVLVKN